MKDLLRNLGINDLDRLHQKTVDFALFSLLSFALIGCNTATTPVKGSVEALDITQTSTDTTLFFPYIESGGDINSSQSLEWSDYPGSGH